MKRLVINADDLGLAASVNRGIFDTIEGGVVTSTSLIVNMAACDDAIERLRDWRSRGDARTLSVGLHFNIVAGTPKGVCPSLVQGTSRRFHSLPVLAWKAFTRQIAPTDVESELEAQLARAKQVLAPLGMRVSHIDSHRHVHCLPGVFEVVLRTAKRHGIGHVRHPYETQRLIARPRALLAAHLLRAVAPKERPLDDVAFAGIGAMGSRTFANDIAALITALPAGTTELMVHPGYDSAELAALDAYRAPRERELRALTSPALRDRILESGVQLTPFDARAASGSAARGQVSAAS